MITSTRACVACNYLWSWPISSKSFSHDFAIKLLKYGTSCHVHSTASTVLDGFFPYLTQVITNMKGCVIHNDLWPWPISSRAFSHDFVIKLLKYGATCSVHSTICTVLYGFFPYLALMITSMRRCVMQWPLTWTYIFKVIWHCLFHGLYSYVAQIQPMRGQCVTYHFLVKCLGHTGR